MQPTPLFGENSLGDRHCGVDLKRQERNVRRMTSVLFATIPGAARWGMIVVTVFLWTARVLAVEPTAEEARLITAPYSGPHFAGILTCARLDEASGLAASRRDPDLLWSHNDSDAEPELFALSRSGVHRGLVRVRGAINDDWESIRSFEKDGRSWLAIGDIGFDNGKRTQFTIYVVPEPDPHELCPDQVLEVEVAWSFSFTYDDGAARDCESMAVDVGEGAIYLLEKRVYPSSLYRLPLRPSNGELQVPVRIASVTTIPQPDDVLAKTRSVKASWRANSTDMDFAADGSAAVVVTYANAYLFPRAPGESWQDAFARSPQRLPTFHLDIAEPEAICFGADSRTIYITCEKPPAPVLRYEALAPIPSPVNP
ncbi:MAG TPA: hypothetical protein PLN52_14805 [Opitutaceae bacterium]|nr:hypothetical protein [Opitutaceae bacterium]